jgi:hypothetical protein
MSTPSTRTDAIVDRIVAGLVEGRSLAAVCADEGMPDRVTVYRWSKGDDDLAARIMEAREIGFHDRAERAVKAAQECVDPIKGRLSFDAERWYLGKLSNAFADKPVVLGVGLNVDAGDAFAAIAGALEGAAAAIQSRGTSTRTVDYPSPSRSADATGRLADLAGSGGERLGQDANGS